MYRISFTVSMCDRIGVSVCAYNMCVQHVFVCVCVCVCVCVVCVWCVCVCGCVGVGVGVLLNTIDTTKNPIRYLFLEHSCAGFLCSLYV